jgi:uncharacterized membrane protein required for colicin V production
MSNSEDAPGPKPPRDWTAVWIAMITTAGGYAFGKFTGDWVVGGLLMISGLTAASGYRLGAIAVGSLIAGCAASYSLAPQYAYVAEPFLESKLGLTGLVNRGASLATVAVTIALTTLALGCVLRAVLIAPNGKANRIDRWLGAVFGGCEGLTIATILLCGAVFLEPFARQQLEASDSINTTPVAFQETSSRDSANPSLDKGAASEPNLTTWVSKAVIQVAEHTEHSRVAPLAEKFDPLQNSSWGRTMKDVVTVVGNPEAMEQFLEHSSFGELSEKPELHAAAVLIANDPDVKRIVDENGGVNRDSLTQLLASPRFLELIDETGVTREMAGIAKHLSPALHDVANQSR